MIPSPFGAEALREYRLFESSDLDETRESISRVMQPHRLVPGGKSVRSHMDFVKLGNVGIGTIAFGGAMRVNVEAVDGYHLLMFCIAGQAQVRTRQSLVSVDQRNGVLCAAGEPFDASLSPDCEQFILRIDRSALGSHFWSSRRGPATHVRIDSPGLMSWTQQLNLIVNSPALLNSARERPEIGNQLGRLLIELLRAGPEQAQDNGKHPRLSPGFIKRAEDYLHEYGDEPLRLSAVATALGIPERTLRDGFQQFLGISPTRYLRQLRLERAHKALLNAPDGTSVSAVALDCGFMHLGRFSLEYKKRFGESPSETLGRR
jgi:AraC-like DNA-binding protein